MSGSRRLFATAAAAAHRGSARGGLGLGRAAAAATGACRREERGNVLKHHHSVVVVVLKSVCLLRWFSLHWGSSSATVLPVQAPLTRLIVHRLGTGVRSEAT